MPDETQGKSRATPPTRSLRASVHPQARMQEMLRQSAEVVQPKVVQPEADQAEEGNNEGNFITSQLPNKETINEDKQEDNLETPKLSTHKISKGVSKEATQEARQRPMKLSLKETVLEDKAGHEEKALKTRLNVDIDEDLHFWLKGHAIQNRRKLNDLIPRILKAYRDEVEGEQQ